jgi:hypothetical protein
MTGVMLLDHFSITRGRNTSKCVRLNVQIAHYQDTDATARRLCNGVVQRLGCPVSSLGGGLRITHIGGPVCRSNNHVVVVTCRERRHDARTNTPSCVVRSKPADVRRLELRRVIQYCEVIVSPFR